MYKNINEEDLAFRLKVARQVRKMGQSELAKKIGVTNVTLSKWEQGHTAPTADIIEKIAKVLDCPPGWLFAGKTNREKYISENFEDYVIVPQVAGEISAGYGLAPDNVIEMRIAFRKEWIQRKGDPKDMALIRVRGDSMDPTLLSGDLVLVDRSRISVDPQGGIYAIAIDGQIMLKRIQLLWPAQKVKIISDNPRYETIEVESTQVKINGKVVWFGREIEK